MTGLTIDRARSAARIDADIHALAGSRYTMSAEAITRYAFADAYQNTIKYFAGAWRELGFEVRQDPIGNLIARNRAPGEPVFGIGSHCDSNRNGGKWDGTLGVVSALELCRLNSELQLDLPLQAISFLEEEGSGFGQPLLGSRVVLQRLDEQDLRERIRAIDDQRPFWDHARDAGFRPDRWPECARTLDGLIGWIELHIEQGRVLQDTGHRLGIVRAIAGYVHGDITFEGRADHSGATPMNMRRDSAVVAAMTVAELERLALSAGADVVGTVGEIEVQPGFINVIPELTRISIDARGPDDAKVRDVIRRIVKFGRTRAGERGIAVRYQERQAVTATQLDTGIAAALESEARAVDAAAIPMVSGAAHDTMLVATRVPSAMLFVPCRDGISHNPAEEADPLDAALGVEVMLKAIQTICTTM